MAHGGSFFVQFQPACGVCVSRHGCCHLQGVSRRGTLLRNTTAAAWAESLIMDSSLHPPSEPQTTPSLVAGLPASTTSIQCLPTDALAVMFAFLSAPDVVACSRVCREVRAALRRSLHVALRVRAR